MCLNHCFTRGRMVVLCAEAYHAAYFTKEVHNFAKGCERVHNSLCFSFIFYLKEPLFLNVLTYKSELSVSTYFLRLICGLKGLYMYKY